MSRHLFTSKNHLGNYRVAMGYDQPLHSVFCNIHSAAGELVYSNLSDPAAGTRQLDVNYYGPILEQFGMNVPNTVFEQVADDRKNGVGSGVIDHGPLN
jgi:hypothetical protein